jgi:hypothetical protein
MRYQDQKSISDYYRVLQQEIQERILGEKDATILHSSTDELVDYYTSSEALLTQIEFDPQRQPEMEHKKEMRRVPAEQRQEVYSYQGDLNFEYESIVVTVPILPTPRIQEILRMKASTFSLSGQPGVTVTDGGLVFQLDIKGYGFELTDDHTAAEVNAKLTMVKQWLEWKNADIRKENLAITRNVRTFIEERKKKLNADQGRIASLVQKINIPLKQKTNEAAMRIKIDPRPIVKKVKPNPKLPEEYVLDRPKVLDIVSVIDSQGRQFEKTPKTYANFEEEGLRDVLLVNLNSLFEGKATGETFSNKGKTDIYLNIDKGNVLTFECKIWGGSALYTKTIDQLLGYLTWRQNFGIMVTFVRQKNFSKVISDAPDAITQHSSYRSGFKQVSPTHFISLHVLPNDEGKQVEIHHLFYNLYA